MDRINFQNNVTKLDKEMFDTFQNNIEKSAVVVSTTQPTTNEKVWFKKGKNLLNKNNYFVDKLGYVGFVVNLEYGQTYTMSSNIPIIAKFATQSNLAGPTVGPQNWIKFTSWTFVAGQNTGNYLNNVVFIGINEKEMQKNVEAYSNYNIQIEQGSTATTYEEYVESTVYVKNASGVYEEFINNEAKKYSANELAIGTWIDGETVYRKIIEATSPAVNDTSTNIYNISDLNIKEVIKIEGTVYSKSASFRGPINSYINATDYITTWLYCEDTNKPSHIRCRCHNRGNSPMKIILEYTKN